MSKHIPVYMQGPQPVLVQLGMICGRPLYVELSGDEETREQDFIRITHIIYEGMGIKNVRHDDDYTEVKDE